MQMPKQEAIDFFSEIYFGEHHIPSKIKEFGTGWSVLNFGDVATFDGDRLTRLVFLAHDKCYRVSIEQGGPGTIKIIVWKREGREGVFCRRHPTLESAVESWRKINPPR